MYASARGLDYARATFNVSSKRLVCSSVSPSCLRCPRAASMCLLVRPLSYSNTRFRMRGEPDDIPASSQTKTRFSRNRRIWVCPNNSIEKFTLFTWNGSKTSVCSSTCCLWFTAPRSEEHTSELQSPYDLVCRLLLEKKKYTHLN